MEHIRLVFYEVYLIAKTDDEISKALLKVSSKAL